MSYEITNMWNLIKMIQKIYSQNRNRLKDCEAKIMVSKGEMLEEGVDGEVGISIYTLLDA